MRNRSLYALILFLIPTATFAQDDDARAMAIAKETLDRGAALFDTRDAAAMAATYVEAGQLILIKRESDSGNVVVENRNGRAAIEKAYSDLFKDRLPEHRSRNTVESARFLGNDFLMIRGRFAMNREQGDTVQFVQIRAREGDQWKIVTLQLMDLPR